jgi:hypothetical protein
MLLAQMPNYLPTLLLDYAGSLAAAMVGALLTPVMWQGLALGFFGAGMDGSGISFENDESTGLIRPQTMDDDDGQSSIVCNSRARICDLLFERNGEDMIA